MILNVMRQLVILCAAHATVRMHEKASIYIRGSQPVFRGTLVFRGRGTGVPRQCVRFKINQTNPDSEISEKG